MNKTKIVLFLVIIISMNYSFSNSGYDTDDATCSPIKEIDSNVEVVNQPLLGDETLDWDYDSAEQVLRIYKILKSKKTLYFTVDNIHWNDWSFSKDHKRFIYNRLPIGYESFVIRDHYYFDGNTGKTTYLGRFHDGYTSSDFKYVIYQDSEAAPKLQFTIFNLETNTVEKNISWKLKSEKYFADEENTTYIFRSDLPEYDFHIYIVGMGEYIFAEGYLSIKENKIVTFADDEEDDRILDLNGFSKYELGK